MFLVVNIVFILLIIRVSLNGKILNTIMGYRWALLLRYQHLFFFLVFTLITWFTGSYFVDFPALILYTLFVVFPNIGIYYLVYGFLVPKYYLANKYPAFILYGLVIFLISTLFRILLEPTLFAIPITDNTFTHANFLYLVYSLQALVILIASFLGITKDKFLIEQDMQDLGEQKEQLHLDLLKSKLSPHFLLNTLNNIYVKSFDPQGKTSESILQLSRLLQYVIYDSGEEKIPLAKEFSTMHALLLLYKLKYNEELAITFTIANEESLEIIEVPPAIFLTPFENALKHSGIGLNADSFIHIHYKIEGKTLFFEIKNSLPSRKADLETGYQGLGNETLLKILEKYYADRYSFVARQTETATFLTTLKIDL